MLLLSICRFKPGATTPYVAMTKYTTNVKHDSSHHAVCLPFKQMLKCTAQAKQSVYAAAAAVPLTTYKYV